MFYIKGTILISRAHLDAAEAQLITTTLTRVEPVKEYIELEVQHCHMYIHTCAYKHTYVHTPYCPKQVLISVQAFSSQL